MTILQHFRLQAENSGTFAGSWLQGGGDPTTSISPIDATKLAAFHSTSSDQYEQVVQSSRETFTSWSRVPAPKRGLLIRDIANVLRQQKHELAHLLTLEMGKILVEAEGEIQEAIDIADFAVGLSRQLYGLSMHSERPEHRMYEQWHPLGPVGVITAFNFPVAVWAWNAMIAAICGDTIIWKPSQQTPAISAAVTQLVMEVAAAHGFPALFSMLTGDAAIGCRLAEDRRIPLISATGSCAMGRDVGERVAKRLGKSLLELGGNNAVIVLADADMELVVRAVVFGAVGTAGQRCTTTRRVLVERSVMQHFVDRLCAAYAQVTIGSPFEPATLMGPLISTASINAYNSALARAREDGATIAFGGNVLRGMPSELYVQPTIVVAEPSLPLLHEETFAPILYVVGVDSVEQAIELNNAVPQGLSSAIFTNNLRAAERFLSAQGSDCGIANVNLGTSGAEIGGAFGGEKDTGGGREAGSDAWKSYMRRQTSTINWSEDLPLAQGIVFS